jgi:hypothetical protein
MFCQQTKPRAGIAKILSDGEKLFVMTLSKNKLFLTTLSTFICDYITQKQIIPDDRKNGRFPN